MCVCVCGGGGLIIPHRKKQEFSSLFATNRLDLIKSQVKVHEYMIYGL